MLKYSWVPLLFLFHVHSQTTDKYSDEDRPYKFGFNIQGYQHRQEEKDERGLIKGEYGFITADGYYRVTVYATDENGDFRIISMKNYYVGFPPEDPTTTPGPSSQRSGNAKPLTFGSQPGAQGRALSVDDRKEKSAKPFTLAQGLAACSDCSIPTTTTRTNQGVGVGDFRGGRKESGFGGSGGVFGQGSRDGNSPPSPQGSPKSNIQGNFGSQPLPLGTPERSGGDFGRGSPQSPQGSPKSNIQGNFGSQPLGTPERFGNPTGERRPKFPQGEPQAIQKTSGFFGSQPTGPGSSIGGGNQQNEGGIPGAIGTRDFGSPRGPNQYQNNQLGGAPRQRPRVGEVREGLPPGVTLNDIKDLLYTFNYTVGFHGHHEDGYRNGDKLGDYFFDGRDGVERKVEYLANEFGYQPNITLIDLPENDLRRPNEQTEKEYGLKGYEFKWFYRK